MNERNRTLKHQYKLSKPDMGIFTICLKEGGYAYLQATQDLKGTMNGALAKLNGGMHPWLELQRAWTALGANAFETEILERLPYDKDEAKTDYTEELKILEMLWEEKLQKQGITLYKKRLG